MWGKLNCTYLVPYLCLSCLYPFTYWVSLVVGSCYLDKQELFDLSYWGIKYKGEMSVNMSNTWLMYPFYYGVLLPQFTTFWWTLKMDGHVFMGSISDFLFVIGFSAWSLACRTLAFLSICLYITMESILLFSIYFHISTV